MSRHRLAMAAAVLAATCGGVAALRGESGPAGGPAWDAASIDRVAAAAPLAPEAEPSVFRLPSMAVPLPASPAARAAANAPMSLSDAVEEVRPASLADPVEEDAPAPLTLPAMRLPAPTVAVRPNVPRDVFVRADDPPEAEAPAPVEEAPPAPDFSKPSAEPEEPRPVEIPAAEPPAASEAAAPPVELPALAVPAAPAPAVPALPPLQAGPPAPRAEDTDAAMQRLVGDPHLGQYAARLQCLPPSAAGGLPPRLPGEALWWRSPVARPLWTGLTPVPVNVNALVISALDQSPQVLALRLGPEVIRHAVCEERAAFDWNTFIEATYDDISDPVGNTLTTGGDPRLEDRVLASTSGLRKRFDQGGDLEVSQRLGYQDNNSQFFVPTQQGTSRLSLSFTQPLMNGRGKAYQQSQIVLAALNTGMAEDETTRRLQDHLLQVAEAYWDLYRARCLYLQRRKVLIQAEQSLATLEGRKTIDALPRQILRARSAVTSRRSQIARAAAEVRNHEARLRMLVGDPSLQATGGAELLPMEAPESFHIPVSMASAAADALMNRADVRRAVKELRGTAVRLGVAEHEMMPRLDVVLSGYLSGLQGDSDLSGSFTDQFTEGRPSFAAGILFEVPLGRRAATARRQQRQMELVRATHEFEATVENALTEVELAVREVETTYLEMLARYEEMRASQDEAAYLEDRWELMPGGNGSASRLLEDLLDAQERLTDDEGGLTTAQVNYLLALAHLRRSTGTLLQFTPAAKVGQPDVVVPAVSEDRRLPSGEVSLAGGRR